MDVDDMTEDSKKTVNPLSGSCPHEIAEESLFRVLGNPKDLENQPCDEDLEKEMYDDDYEITWSVWSNKMKIPLLKSLFTGKSFSEVLILASTNTVEDGRKIIKS